jgi:hypothetical protein
MTKPTDTIRLAVDLSEDQAEALAQMVKRFCWEDAERLANRFDGGREREHILEAIGRLERALADAGFATG